MVYIVFSNNSISLLLVDTLRLSENSIGGRIPEELYDLGLLSILELNDMNLTGTLSTRIGDLQQLYVLRLRRNMLTGTIPTEVASLLQLREYLVVTYVFLNHPFRFTHGILYPTRRSGMVSPQSFRWRCPDYHMQ